MALGGGAQAACTQTPAQVQQAAQAVARTEAQRRVVASLGMLQLLYSGITSDVQVGGARVAGDTATVPGTVVLRGTERSSGKAVQARFPGTVVLKRAADCTWQFSSYRRD
ncbi:hypothetical protein [Deinococcus petrolearius]|uniref:Uncharacterized protein n=1 Tax=Deinococcus petrolearius TaxID=1751295 RepID=A0ABW1DH93_9DEIO